MAIKILKKDFEKWYEKVNVLRRQNGIQASIVTEAQNLTDSIVSADRVITLVNQINGARNLHTLLQQSHDAISIKEVDDDNITDEDTVKKINEGLTALLRTCINIDCTTIVVTGNNVNNGCDDWHGNEVHSGNNDITGNSKSSGNNTASGDEVHSGNNTGSGNNIHSGNNDTSGNSYRSGYSKDTKKSSTSTTNTVGSCAHNTKANGTTGNNKSTYSDLGYKVDVKLNDANNTLGGAPVGNNHRIDYTNNQREDTLNTNWSNHGADMTSSYTNDPNYRNYEDGSGIKSDPNCNRSCSGKWVNCYDAANYYVEYEYTNKQQTWCAADQVRECSHHGQDNYDGNQTSGYSNNTDNNTMAIYLNKSESNCTDDSNQKTVYSEQSNCSQQTKATGVDSYSNFTLDSKSSSSGNNDCTNKTARSGDNACTDNSNKTGQSNCSKQSNASGYNNLTNQSAKSGNSNLTNQTNRSYAQTAQTYGAINHWSEEEANKRTI